MAENVLSGRLALPESRYPDGASRARFQTEALAALRAMPGVTEVGFTSMLPFAGDNTGSTIAIDGVSPTVPLSIQTSGDGRGSIFPENNPSRESR